MPGARQIAAIVFLLIAIVSLPLTFIFKYGKKNRFLTTITGVTGAAATLAFMIAIWPYLPED